MTSKEHERLARLKRRCDFLEARIDQRVLERDYDKAELSALKWAINFIEGALDYQGQIKECEENFKATAQGKEG